MVILIFSEQEVRMLIQCIDAATSNIFFDDDLFVTLCGFEKTELIKIKETLNDYSRCDEISLTKLVQVIHQFFGYPHKKEKHWHDFIEFPPKQVFDFLMLLQSKINLTN